MVHNIFVVVVDIGVFFLLLHYQKMFIRTNCRLSPIYTSKIYFQSKKYSKLMKTIFYENTKNQIKMYSGNVPKKELFSLVPRLGLFNPHATPLL